LLWVTLSEIRIVVVPWNCLIEVLMIKFIELNVSDETEVKTQLINVASIGRVYPNPQSTRKSIVELNYQSVNDAPVYLEVEMPYETLRSYFIG
jgi:hypothetical protein